MPGVIRPTFSGNAEQLALLDAAVRAAQQADEKQTEADTAKAEGWQAILRARLAGVPDELLCERTGWSRATLNRKFGPRP